MQKSRDYKKDYEEFWKDIVESNGELNKDQVMRELSDFRMLMDHLSKIYDLASGGMVSIPTTKPEEVYELFLRRLKETYNEGYSDAEDDLRGVGDAPDIL